MAVTTAVLSGNVADLTGTADPAVLATARLYIESNTTDGALLDTAGSKIMVGLEQVTVNATTGAFSHTLVRTDSTDIVPATGRMYRAHLDYREAQVNGGMERKRIASGWFTLTANTGLAVKWTGIETLLVPTSANLNDVAMTNVDASAASTFRVQQDARLSATFDVTNGQGPTYAGAYGAEQSATAAANRTALQAGLDAVHTKGKFVLPPGLTTIDAPVYFPTQVAIEGHAFGSTVEQITSGQPALVEKNYSATYGGSPSGQVAIRDFTVVVPAVAGSHGIILRDYYSTIDNVKVVGGDKSFWLTALNDASVAVGGTLVENRITNCTAIGFVGYGYYIGVADNNKLTDGYLTDCVASGAAGAISHVFIGSAAGWVVDGIHTYGTVTSHSIQLNGTFHTNIDNIYIETFGASAGGLVLTSAQRAVNIDNLSVKFPDSATTIGALYVTRSGAYATVEVNVGNFHAVQNYNHAANALNLVTSGITARIANYAAGGTYSAQVTRKTGSGAVIAAADGITTQVTLSAPELHVVTGASINQLGTTGVISWLFDAATAETVAGVVRLPDEWQTYDITLLWAPTTADAGSVRWDYGLGFITPGAAVGTTYVGVVAGSTAPGVTAQAVSYALASGLTNQSGKPAAFRIIRAATDATYDTYPADAALLAVVFSKAS